MPRRGQNGAPPRRKAFHNLMGPPINHWRFSSLYARLKKPGWPGRTARMLLFSRNPAQIAVKN
jgi:hypothetical protein